MVYSLFHSKINMTTTIRKITRNQARYSDRKSARGSDLGSAHTADRQVIFKVDLIAARMCSAHHRSRTSTSVLYTVQKVTDVALSTWTARPIAGCLPGMHRQNMSVSARPWISRNKQAPTDITFTFTAVEVTRNSTE